MVDESPSTDLFQQTLGYILLCSEIKDHLLVLMKIRGRGWNWNGDRTEIEECTGKCSSKGKEEKIIALIFKKPMQGGFIF